MFIPVVTKFDTSATGSFPTVQGESGLGQTKYFQNQDLKYQQNWKNFQYMIQC